MTYDLTISGNHCCINCMCSRFTTDNYTNVIETWMTKSNLQNLRNSIRPGAVKDLFSALGLPHFYDMSFSDKNTLRLIPNPSSASAGGSNLGFMRKEKIIYCKNIVAEPLEASNSTLNVKIEGFVSGASEL